MKDCPDRYFAKLNMDKFDVYYFSSEMGAQELRGRMEKFDYPQERFHEWYMTRETSIYAKRLDTYALRTMPLFAAINLQNTIDLDIVERVIKLMNWQLLMRKLYSPIDADNKMAQIEERIRRNLRMKPLTERELKRNIHADRCGEFYFSHAKANLLRSKDVYYNNTTKKYHLGVSV